jgi:hypothetical protein
MLAGQLALLTAALFAGAAVYVSAVEHNARMQLDDRAMLMEWKPAYKRGATLQAPLALIGFALGVVAWLLSGQVLWLAGAGVLVAAWPYTLLRIMPTNRRLLAIEPAAAGPEVRELMQRWAHLHGRRTALGLAATAIFLCASLR